MNVKQLHTGWALFVYLLVVGCSTPPSSRVTENSTHIDQQMALLLSNYERAWRNFRISGNEGTACDEYAADRELVSYVRTHHKAEALRTYILCAPDGPHADEFRAEILRLYLSLSESDHEQFCREALARRLLDKTYQHAFRVGAALYLAQQRDPLSLEFALHLSESGVQYAQNDGILVVCTFYGWREVRDIIRSDHWHLPDPWYEMDNTELAKDVSGFLRSQGVQARFAPGAEEKKPNHADEGNGL